MKTENIIFQRPVITVQPVSPEDFARFWFAFESSYFMLHKSFSCSSASYNDVMQAFYENKTLFKEDN